MAHGLMTHWSPYVGTRERRLSVQVAEEIELMHDERREVENWHMYVWGGTWRGGHLTMGV